MTPSPRPAVTPAPVAVAAPASAPEPAAPGAKTFDAIFDEEGTGNAPVPRVVAAAAPPPPSAPAELAVWPGTVLSAVDGEAVVRAALSGLWPEPRLRGTTERVVASLSTAEKAATLGQKLPFDPLSVRRAVGLRWQVAAALDTLPIQGAKVDQPAIQAILLGIDDVLGQLKVLSDDASPDALCSLEGVRHALVKEAIDLTEALQQILPADVVEEITTSRKAKRAEPAPVTRVVHSMPKAERERPQVPWGLVVVLVLAVAGAAAYHGYRYVNRSKQAVSTISGAPSGTVGTVTPKGKVVVAPAGARLDPGEVENFKNLERAKGNVVREIAPGTFIVSPEKASPDARAGSSAAPTQGAKP